MKVFQYWWISLSIWFSFAKKDIVYVSNIKSSECFRPLDLVQKNGEKISIPYKKYFAETNISGRIKISRLHQGHCNVLPFMLAITLFWK